MLGHLNTNNMRRTYNIILITIITLGIIALNNYKIKAEKITYELNSEYQPKSLKEGLEMSSTLEKVSVVAQFNYDKFIYNNHLSDDATMEEVNAYRDAKRAAGRAYHSVLNKRIASTLSIKGYDSVFVSSLLPFIEYTFSQDEYVKNQEEVLAKLTSHREVSNVIVKSAVTNQQEKFQGAIGEANAGQIYDSRSYTGDGVTVGVLDVGIIDASHTNMQGHSITYYDQPGFTEEVTEHATVCASLIGGNIGMAPDVTFLSSGLKTNNLYGEVEWMVNHGADIINMSFGETTPTGRYDSNSAYVDNMVKTYDVICVAAVGNDGAETGKVCNPALGYNVIGVGATTSTGDVLGSSSTQVLEGPSKPTIGAPGYCLTIENCDIGYYGTSFACAFTSGMIATLLEAHPALKTKPEMVLAMLTANAKHISGYDKTKTNGFNKYLGAGRIDLQKTVDNYNRIWSFQNSSGYDGKLVYHFSAYLMEGVTLQAAFAWLATANVSNHQASFNNYEARIVRRSDGVVCAVADSMGDNIQFLRYVTDKEDFYDMRIYQRCGSISTSSPDDLAFAYRMN